MNGNGCRISVLILIVLLLLAPLVWVLCYERSVCAGVLWVAGVGCLLMLVYIIVKMVLKQDVDPFCIIFCWLCALAAAGAALGIRHHWDS